MARNHTHPWLGWGGQSTPPSADRTRPHCYMLISFQSAFESQIDAINVKEYADRYCEYLHSQGKVPARQTAG